MRDLGSDPARRELHRLVEALPEEKLSAARDSLQELVSEDEGEGAGGAEEKQKTDLEGKERSWTDWLLPGILLAVGIAVGIFFIFDPGHEGSSERKASRGQSPPPQSAGQENQQNHLHFFAFAGEGDSLLYLGTHEGLAVSEDGGRTWKDVEFFKGRDVMNFTPHPARPESVVVGGHLLLARTDDGGKSWKELGRGLPSTDIHGLASGGTDPWILYAYVADRGLFVSSDAGETWEDRKSPPGKHIMALAADPSNPQVVYAGDMESGIYRSRDGGRSWEEASQGLGDRSVLALEVDPREPEVVYAATSTGIYRSGDRGNSWKLVYDSPLQALAAARGRGKIYALKASGGLVVSDDRGLTWTPLQ